MRTASLAGETVAGSNCACGTVSLTCLPSCDGGTRATVQSLHSTYCNAANLLRSGEAVKRFFNWKGIKCRILTCTG